LTATISCSRPGRYLEGQGPAARSPGRVDGRLRGAAIRVRAGGGPVSISENLDELRALSIRIAERYVAPELARRFGERNAVEGELLVRLHPEKITGFGDMTG
jgi:hypothetical protein